MGKRLSFLTLGPSLAGSSDILMASSIAASRPLPPSPLSAGPKHSGRRMRRRTTTLAFSSTLSPARREPSTRSLKSLKKQMEAKHHQRNKKIFTVDEDGEAEKVQVFLSTTGIPANVWVAFGKKHGTALKATPCQIFHHLERLCCPYVMKIFAMYLFLSILLEYV